MNIILISSTDGPASWDFPAHGLGKQCLMQAENLAKAGHFVTLIAGQGSKSNELGVTIVECLDDQQACDWAIEHQANFDLIFDSSHWHFLRSNPRLETPLINYSPDREEYPGRCAAFPTKNHQKYFDIPGVIIPNAVDLQEFSYNASPSDYFLWMAKTYPQKGFKTAFHAAMQTGINLVFAGPGTENFPNGKGPVFGEEKVKLLQNAKALLFPSPHEAGPITVLEAAACGTPVICYNKGGAADHVRHNETGFAVEDQEEFITAIGKIDTISRKACREFIEQNHSPEFQTEVMEHVFQQLLSGVRW